MKYGFLVKNYSSMQTDKGKPYKTEYVELDTNKPKDREYYGIREGQSLNTVKKKYKQFWGGDVAIINEVEYKNHRPSKLNVERPSILGNSSFGFNTQSRSKRPNILNMSVSSFGFNTQSRSKRPNILNMSVPNILRKR